MVKLWAPKTWLGILLAALAIRTLTAIFAYGPQAIDDYKHGIMPASLLAEGSAELPGYRSPFLVYYLAPWLSVGRTFGELRPVDEARVIEGGLGLLSLLGFLGLYWFFKKRPKLHAHQNDDLAFTLSVLLYAFFPLMPFASTRAFGESACIPFVMMAFGAFSLAWREDDLQKGSGEISTTSRKYYLIAFASLLLAVSLRPQVGLFVLPLAIFVVWRRSAWLWIVAGSLALVGLATQAAVDVSFGRPAFSSLQEYLRENSGGAAKYGVSPWYNTWLTALGMMLIPLSLPFFVRRAVQIWRAEKILGCLLLFFVAVHSLIAHKEERFLYPIAPLLLVALSIVWSTNWGKIYERWIFRPIVLFLCTIGTLLVAFSNPQSGIVTPLADEGAREIPTIFVDLGSSVGESFVKEHFIRGADEYKTLEQLKTNEGQRQVRWVLLLPSGTEVPPRVQEFLRDSQIQCGPQQTAQSVLDAWLVQMNAEWNQRRRPTAYFVCTSRA